MKRKLLIPLLLVATLPVAGCGESGAHSDLRKTAANVDRIKSGTLTYSLLVTPQAKRVTHPFGFRLHGPFHFGANPSGRVDYTQIANGKHGTVTVDFGPSGGYVLSGADRRSLSDAQLAAVRQAAAAANAGAKTDLSSWLEEPRACGMRCVEGHLHVANTIVGLLRLSGSDVELSKQEAAQLDDAGRSATYRVRWVGDHLLRELRIHLALAFDVPPTLQAALGNLAGATFDLDLAIANPVT